MNIEEIRNMIRQGKYEISLHAEKERYAEDITVLGIKMAILQGEILEKYTNDPRGVSCLLLGYLQNRPVHIICGYTSSGWVRIITVYIPKPPKWIDEKTRAKER